MADTATRRVLAGLLALALLPPLLWAGIGYLIERGHADAAARAIAWAADRQLAGLGGLDSRAVAALLDRPPLEQGAEQRSIVDGSGAVIASGGEPGGAAWPALSTTHPMRSAGGAVAGVQVQHSLRGLMLGAALVALSSTALALALWAGTFRQPIGALRQAETRLRRFARHDALTGLLNRDGLRLAPARMRSSAASAARAAAARSACC